MQELTMLEFKSLCERLAPVSFVYDSENQENEESVIGARISSRYSDIAIGVNQKRIRVFNASGYLDFNGVKLIEYGESCLSISKKFRITCGDFGDNSRDVSYILLADKIF